MQVTSGRMTTNRSARLLLWIMLVPAIFAATTRSAEGQTFKVIHSFTGGADGATPNGDLMMDARGNLRGTTAAGGTGPCDGGCGTVFMVLSTGREGVLYNFTNTPDGENPRGGLLHDRAGNLYGTTGGGGSFGFGSVFKLDKTGKVTVVFSFPGGLSGSAPNGDLVGDAAGNLYGTTTFGGSSNCGDGCGIVFKVDHTGNESVLYTFLGGYLGPDGAWPSAGVIRDQAGNLYGTTSWGGPSSYGTVFKVTGGQVTLLHGFSDVPDGRYPYHAALIEDAAGNLYGTTEGGGQNTCGTSLGCGLVFKIDRAGTETVLYRFVGSPDGAAPVGGLTLDSAGNLYGTTGSDGSAGCFLGCGTVFKLDTAGTLTVLHSFTGKNDGGSPGGHLVVDSSGNVYGTTSGGGRSGLGVVFKITPN